MPYIPQEDRPKIDPHIDAIAQFIAEKTKAENYDGIITGYLTYTCMRLAWKIVKLYFGKIRYHILSSMCGTFTILSMETWRRLGGALMRILKFSQMAT